MQKVLTYIYCYDKIIVVKEIKNEKGRKLNFYK